MKNILNDVEKYYTEKILKFDATPQGVDWNSQESQYLRFDQLIKIIKTDTRFSINDLGCGYGSFYDYLSLKYNSNFTYLGYDLSQEMIKKAKNIYPDIPNCHFHLIKNANEIAISEYTVASGIFNVKMNYSDKEWLNYILHTIETINLLSQRGFSFNILTKYSDEEYKKSNLFYADPCFFFDYCKTHYSKKVSLLHDYELYEFTLLIKKD